MDDLKATTNQSPQPAVPQEPVDQTSQTNVQGEIPPPPPPQAPPSVPPPPPTKTAPTAGEPPPPTITSEKPSGKKISSPIKIGGALVILLLAATLPAAIILVQNQTRIAPKAQEETSAPQLHPSQGRRTYIIPTREEQTSDLIQEIKPQNLKTETPSSGAEKITFTTQAAVMASISYSPDQDWNYIPLMLDYESWKDNYNLENLKNITPVNGKIAANEHEFVIEGLTPGREYYFAIEIERPSENEVYVFGAEQPGNNYTFTVK
jgi:hypothetical protein